MFVDVVDSDQEMSNQDLWNLEEGETIVWGERTFKGHPWARRNLRGQRQRQERSVVRRRPHAIESTNMLPPRWWRCRSNVSGHDGVASMADTTKRNYPYRGTGGSHHRNAQQLPDTDDHSRHHRGRPSALPCALNTLRKQEPPSKTQGQDQTALFCEKVTVRRRRPLAVVESPESTCHSGFSSNHDIPGQVLPASVTT
jgi:hypothetical protein